MNPTDDDQTANDAYFDAQSESVRTGSITLAVACLTTGLFLGTYFTKRAPVSLIISSS